jgi:hypothetical protein
MAPRQGQEPPGSPAASIEAAVTQLERLENALRTDGWQATIVIARDHWPRVHVANPSIRALNDDVIAAPDTSGNWWFWWSWAERIAHVTDPARALARITQVLAVDGEG